MNSEQTVRHVTVDIERGRSGSKPNDDNLPPPTYEEAIKMESPPPSYESLLTSIGNAEKETNNVFELTLKVVILIVGRLYCSCLLIFLQIMPVLLTALGLSSFLLRSCITTQIASYLLVLGLLGLMKQLFNMCGKLGNLEDVATRARRDVLIGLIMLFWFIIGSVWVYNSDLTFECPSYMVAFWFTTIGYCFLIILIVVSASLLFIFTSMGVPQHQDGEEDNT